MSHEDGLAQLVSSYGSDKSSSEDEQLEEIQCKTDQCDKIKTKDLKDGYNFYDNINNAEARWVVCDMLKPRLIHRKLYRFVGEIWFKNLNSGWRKTFEVHWKYSHTFSCELGYSPSQRAKQKRFQKNRGGKNKQSTEKIIVKANTCKWVFIPKHRLTQIRKMSP